MAINKKRVAKLEAITTAKTSAGGSDVKSAVALSQARAGMRRRYWIETLEDEGGVHSHLLVAMPRGQEEKLNGLVLSKKFGQYDHMRLDGSIDTFLDLKPVRPAELDNVVNYLMKTMSPQAHFAIGKTLYRLPGSHPLGAGGGDRVRLSDDLYDVQIRYGRIEPYRRTYAKAPRIEAIEIIIVPSGYLFDDLPALPVEPEQRKPYKRPLLVERYGPQAELDLLPPPGIIDLAASLGGTHREIAEKLGISRPQVTNIICGRFRPSRRVVERVLKLARVGVCFSYIWPGQLLNMDRFQPRHELETQQTAEREGDRALAVGVHVLAIDLHLGAMMDDPLDH